MDNIGNMLQLCRLCLVKEQVNIAIFDEQSDIRQIFQKISLCLPVKVSQDDKLPKRICDGCSYKLDLCYEFWNTSVNSEKQLLTWLDEEVNGSQHQPVKPTTDAIVKQEAVDPTDIHKEEDDEDKSDVFVEKVEENNAGPSATVTTNEDEPPPKRQRRTAAAKAAMALANDSDDDDDSGEPLTKMEDESEDSDGEDNDPSFADIPSTSADDQPGPSGIGKEAADAPILAKSEFEELVITIVEDGDNVYVIPRGEGFDMDDDLLFKTDDKTPRILASVDTENDESQDGMAASDTDHRKKYLCPICGKLINKHGWRKHTMTHNQFDDDENGRNLLSEINKSYPCKSCSYVCQNPYEYAIHSYNHTAMYYCPVCKFTSKTLSPAMSHIKRHEGNFRYNCHICGRGFLHRTLLTTHEEIHLDIKRHECDLCGKKFTVEKYLKVHRMLNHKKELFGIEQKYKCDICEKEFSFLKSMIRHKNTIHHIGRDRSVECPVCSKVIANNTNLRIHMRRHTGEKKFCCEVCGKAFTARKYWRRHMQTHESKTW